MTHAATGTDALATGAPKEPRLVCINQKVDNENCNYICADGRSLSSNTNRNPNRQTSNPIRPAISELHVEILAVPKVP